jgi:hypothetical protein
MGRELKRVPLDFNWPLGDIWKGYLNPFYKKCPKCHDGYSASYDLLAKHINSLMWDSKALQDENYSKITEFLAGRRKEFLFGHDSTDAWHAVKKIGTLAGLSDNWTKCNYCNGSGIDPEIKKRYESWEKFEPPVGEGYQLWENTSEGSPESPVFITLEELCEWCAENATTFANFKATKEEWKSMFEADFVFHKQGNNIFI